MKRLSTFKTVISASVLLCMAHTANASTPDEFDSQLLSIQKQWAIVNYTLSDDVQENEFKELIESATAFSQAYPERAEPLVWLGIIQSSFAGAKGGIGALSLAKDAKKSLERSLALDESALQGSAYTSLGTLYHKVPGWPLGFGDDDDAKVMLEKAITINPDGIDPNYFYGEFLFDERQYKEAKQHLEHALEAPSRETRPLADESRRAEIQMLLAKVNKKLNR
ncbi:tetratricopeptide repeat protein [Alteromonas facilis]|uniref:tetratricopeptide repeat protein n=1 Tax=Alteromonas facilis TaxID=2048004 RepID=UPI000C281B91|nr:tetratricopeptide repeat protein [Alteromonas facilis]